MNNEKEELPAPEEQQINEDKKKENKKTDKTDNFEEVK